MYRSGIYAIMFMATPVCNFLGQSSYSIPFLML
nr:MAG TPA: hypothetical protein [Caudoviricetes sp.]